RRQLEDTFRLSAEGDFHRSGHLLAEHGAAFDFFADVFEGQMRPRETPAGEALAFTNQAEQQVLGLNGDAAELTGLVSGEKKHPPGPFGVAAEHPGYLRECR